MPYCDGIGDYCNRIACAKVGGSKQQQLLCAKHLQRVRDALPEGCAELLAFEWLPGFPHVIEAAFREVGST
jgi:hypothetical protein